MELLDIVVVNVVTTVIRKCYGQRYLQTSTGFQFEESVWRKCCNVDGISIVVVTGVRAQNTHFRHLTRNK